MYPENVDQRVLILNYAMRAGFSGGVVVDFPHRYARITITTIYNKYIGLRFRKWPVLAEWNSYYNSYLWTLNK